MGRALEDEYCDIAVGLGGDIAGRTRGDDYLRHTHALKDGEAVPWAMNPKIVDERGLSILASAAETMGAILDKMCRRFLDDPAFRSRFDLPATLERYALIPTGYERLIPIARFDVFLDEDTGDFRFCEVTTDGTGGMVNAMEVAHVIQQTDTYREFSRRHPSVHTMDVAAACGRAVLDTYASWEGSDERHRKPDLPSLAIVDYADSVSADEVAGFVDCMRDEGVFVRFADVRDLRMVDVAGERILMDVEGPIDCVWRRIVPSEAAERPCPGLDALMEAVEEGVVCMVGGFRTWPVATKTAFALLWDDDAAEWLDADELAFVHAHVPHTVRLEEGMDLSAFSDREHWIAKPADGFAGAGVVAGLDVDAEAWDEALGRLAQHHGVVQEYVPQYRTPTIYGGPVPGWADPTNYPMTSSIEGLCLFDGRFAGAFCRCGSANVITTDTDWLDMGFLVVDE
jgi:hypothetical protein